MSQAYGSIAIVGGLIVETDRHVTVPADLTIRDGRVARIEARNEVGRGFRPDESTPTLNVNGCIVAPGFIDVQINGAFGIDLTATPEALPDLARHLVSTGVTSFLPTIVSSDPDQVARAIAAQRSQLNAGKSSGDAVGANSLGLHLEGPFIAPARAGAHRVSHLLQPDVETAKAWTTGEVSMVTLAPELLGALDVIDLLVSGGVTVCAGHTEATATQLAQAVEHGLRGVTHLFNAMGKLGHRSPGVPGATLASDRLFAGLIVDGHHIDPLIVKLAWRCLGPRRLILVTDAMAAAGLGDTDDELLNDVQISVTDGQARTQAGVLAGSTLTMIDAVRNLIDFTGCSVAEACSAASRAPAELLSRSDLGRLVPGATGDAVILSTDLEVRATIVGGLIAYQHHSLDVRS